MRQVTIKTYDKVASGEVLAGIREIFFVSSSRQVFKDDAERESFFETWTSQYFKYTPEFIYVALAPNGRVAAYLTGHPHSQDLLDFYHERVPSYALFQDQFKEFPAHLHMNTSPDFRGMGLGQKLYATYEAALKQNASPGIHIVTLASERNVGFYKKIGLTHSVERPFRTVNLLFMGKKL